jgi:hypothetical protein
MSSVAAGTDPGLLPASSSSPDKVLTAILASFLKELSTDITLVDSSSIVHLLRFRTCGGRSIACIDLHHHGINGIGKLIKSLFEGIGRGTIADGIQRKGRVAHRFHNIGFEREWSGGIGFFGFSPW